MDFTDIHINIGSIADSLVFPGPRRPNAGELDLIDRLKVRIDVVQKDDFMVSLDGFFFRGRRDRQVVDGIWVRLRKMAAVPPTLETLPTPIPSSIRSMLLSPLLLSGGLVYVIGAPGQGKTTTSCGAVISRLKQFGGYAYTVEDPPEMPLNGWHGNGYCAQTWVSGEHEADWHEAFKGMLRSQPSGTPCILYVGEARDQESASALLRAASSGFLVLATGFGLDVPSALDNLARVAAKDGDIKSVQDAFAGVLRMVLHQRLIDQKVVVRALVSANARTSVANKIRQGLYAHLEGDLQFQANQLMSGVDVFNDQQKRVA